MESQYYSNNEPCLRADQAVKESRKTNLVNHHNSQQVANGSKEQPIQVMLHSITDRITEKIQDDLSNHEKEYPKRNITQRPTILKRIHHEDDLHNDVNR